MEYFSTIIVRLTVGVPDVDQCHGDGQVQVSSAGPSDGEDHVLPFHHRPVAGNGKDGGVLAVVVGDLHGGAAGASGNVVAGAYGGRDGAVDLGRIVAFDRHRQGGLEVSCREGHGGRRRAVQVVSLLGHGQVDGQRVREVAPASQGELRVLVLLAPLFYRLDGHRGQVVVLDGHRRHILERYIGTGPGKGGKVPDQRYNIKRLSVHVVVHSGVRRLNGGRTCREGRGHGE